MLGNDVAWRVLQTLEVQKDSKLSLRNIYLSSNFPSQGPAFVSEGVLEMWSIRGEGLDSAFRIVGKGALSLVDSVFLNCISLAFVDSSEAVLVFSNCTFHGLQGDLIQLYPQAKATTGKVTFSNISISSMTGHAVNYLSPPSTGIAVSLLGSEVRTSGGLLAGFIANSRISVEGSKFTNLTEMLHTGLDDSDISFEKCTFAGIQSHPFDIPRLKGSVSVSYSAFSEILQGPLFHVTGESPRTAFVVIAHCSVSHLSNPSNQISGILAFATSTTVVVDSTEVQHCQVYRSGLLMVTNGTSLLANLYYHDSAVVISCFMDFSLSTLHAENVTMRRVDNSGGAVMSNMRATAGCWVNVSIEDSVDSEVFIVHDFILLWVGYRSDFIVRDSYFRNKGYTVVSMAVTNDAQLVLLNCTFVDSHGMRVFETFLEGFITIRNVTLVRTSADVVMNCVLSSPCFNVSQLTVVDPGDIYTFLSINQGFAWLSSLLVSNIVLRENDYYGNSQDFHTNSSLNTVIFRIISGSIACFNLTILNSHCVLSRESFNSAINLTFVTMHNCHSDTLLSLKLTQVRLVHFDFLNLDYDQLFDLDNSGLWVEEARLEGVVVGAYGGLVTARAGSELTISRTEIVDLVGKMDVVNGMIYVEDSKVALFSIHLSGFNATFMHSVRSTISLIDAVIQDGGCYRENSNIYTGKSLGCFLYSQNSPQISIVSSSFSNISADFGAVFYFSGSQPDTVTYNISHVDVKNCHSGKSGGVIYGKRVNLLISSSRFSGNRAKNGGVMWLNACNSKGITLENDLFEGNSAVIAGGAIQHINCPIALRNSHFSSNIAAYGADMASKPAYISVIDSSGLPVRNFSIEAASGQALSTAISLGLFDDIDQLVATDNGSVLLLETYTGFELIEGTTLLYSHRGKYTADRLIITGLPLHSIRIKATMDTVSSFAFLVNLRDCRMGEYYEASQCHICSNNMYSFAPAIPCKLCPVEALCTAGFHMSLRSGYWRGSLYTDQIHECIVPEVCAGGLESGCLEGYRGVLCCQCQTGYVKVTQLRCIPRPNVALLVLTVFISFTLLLGVWTYTIPLHPKTELVLSTAFDYFRVMLIVGNCNVHWPAEVSYLLMALGSAGTMGLSLIPHFPSSHYSDMPGPYLNLLLSTAYFLFLLLASTVLACVLYRHSSLSVSQVARIPLHALFLTVPLLVLQTLQLFSCVSIDSVSYLLQDPSQLCSSQLALSLALPTLVISLLILAAITLWSAIRGEKTLLVLSVLMLRSAGMSGVVFAKALTLSAQSCAVVLVTLGADLVLIPIKKSSFATFHVLYEWSLVGITTFLTACVLFLSLTEETTTYSCYFALLSYLCIFSPLIAGFSHLLITKRLRKFQLFASAQPISVHRDEISDLEGHIMAPAPSEQSVLHYQSYVQD